MNGREVFAKNAGFSDARESSLRIHAQLEARLKPITLLVTCYNFEDFFDGNKFVEFLQQSPNVRIVFVDDGSTDKTLQMLLNVHYAVPSRVDVVRLKSHLGKRESVRHGVLHAQAKNADQVLCWDAKNPEPLDTIYRCSGTNVVCNGLVGIYRFEKQLIGRRFRRTGSFYTLSLLGRMVVRLRQSLGAMRIKA